MFFFLRIKLHKCVCSLSLVHTIICGKLARCIWDFGSVLWRQSLSACVNVGGKVWLQNHTRYIILLYHLENTNVNSITTRWFYCNHLLLGSPWHSSQMETFLLIYKAFVIWWLKTKLEIFSFIRKHLKQDNFEENSVQIWITYHHS